MDKQHYIEMENNVLLRIRNNALNNMTIYLFGHCNATEELVDLLENQGFIAKAIMDNNSSKHGTFYRDIPIVAPNEILKESDNTIVLIVARAYESMASQLRKIGFNGEIIKLVEYNSFSEYSLSDDTIKRKQERVERGISKLNCLKSKYPEHFRIFCPFSALGDVYYAMAYLLYFLKKRNIKRYVVCVVGKGCSDVAEMFSSENVEVLLQGDMDEILQAEIYTQDNDFYISHQDRPYVVNLYRALYVKMIPLEVMYRCGVYGLPYYTEPYKPTELSTYSSLSRLKKGKSLIISPYAKSVSNIPMSFWDKTIEEYISNGFEVFTSAVGDEKALHNTKRIEVPLNEMQSVVEYAGHFIGLRSGLCDVIKYADCEKTAVYPDRCYSDTKWKMSEIYHLDGWNNIVLTEE